MTTSKELIKPFVMAEIEKAIEKGWLEIKGNISIKEWKKIPLEKRMDVPVKVTAKGQRELPDDNLLKNPQAEIFTKKYFKKFNVSKDDIIEIELTEDGQRAKIMAEVMGLDFIEHMKNMIDIGTRKQLSRFVMLKDKNIEGQRRIEISN